MSLRVWVDLTNSPHVLVLRPVIERLRAQGAEVQVTARDFAQTVELARAPRPRRDGRRPPPRRAARRRRRSAWPTARRRCARWARGRRFDLALGHGSNDVTVAARLLRIPCSTMFDYEWATVQHNVNCRLAQAVVVPDAIPPERLARYGATRQAAPLPGPQGGVLPRRLRARPGGARRARARPRGADRARAHAARRSRSTTASRTTCSARCSCACASRGRSSCSRAPPSSARSCRRPAASSSPTTRSTRRRSSRCADLVVSAGGTMNREAVALGTPVWTTFEGRLGAVDERADRRGPAAPDRRAPRTSSLERRAGDGGAPSAIRRDPQLLVDLLCSPLAASCARA